MSQEVILENTPPHEIDNSVPAEAAAPMDPKEEAAMKFTKLLPYVKKFGAVMSAKGLSRVLHAIAEFPLGATKPRLLNDNEQQLFHVIQELNGYKSTVIQSIMKQQMDMEKLKQTATELPVVDTGSAEPGETNV